MVTTTTSRGIIIMATEAITISGINMATDGIAGGAITVVRAGTEIIIGITRDTVTDTILADLVQGPGSVRGPGLIHAVGLEMEAAQGRMTDTKEVEHAHTVTAPCQGQGLVPSRQQRECQRRGPRLGYKK